MKSIVLDLKQYAIAAMITLPWIKICGEDAEICKRNEVRTRRALGFRRDACGQRCTQPVCIPAIVNADSGRP